MKEVNYSYAPFPPDKEEIPALILQAQFKGDSRKKKEAVPSRNPDLPRRTSDYFRRDGRRTNRTRRG
jgi:hypothetical protein